MLPHANNFRRRVFIYSYNNVENPQRKVWPLPTPVTSAQSNSLRVSAIVPARNEEAVIAACVESLAQQREIAEIVVVNDQSDDRTAEIVRGLIPKFPQVRLLETIGLPQGWIGKNNAVWLGAQQAKGDWLLFTDADAVHEKDSAAKALQIAAQSSAAMVSFSPEQLMHKWYEKALIPFVYGRLNRNFSFEEINDPQNQAAAANGQFILIRRDAYNAVGGHASIAGEVLEDVALAKLVKLAGFPIWFGSGRGFVRVRMYRSFSAMWAGWRKNLYQLEGGSPAEVYKQLLAESAFLLGPLALVILAVYKWHRLEFAILLGLFFLLTIHAMHFQVLRRGQFSPALTGYLIPGSLLYTADLWASYRSHARGKLEWKGREYPVGTPRASKG
jgi:glycosyltransferase involved in cell wall biosynthesis